MNRGQGLLIPSEVGRTSPFLTGSLLGLGAALVGVSPILGGLRPWHILVVLAFISVIATRGLGALIRMRITSIDAAFVLFILLSAAVEYVNASQLNYEPDFIAVFTDAFYVLAYLAARLSVSDLEHCSRLLRGIVWPAMPMAALGVMQILGVEIVVRFTMAFAPSEAVANRIARGDTSRAWGLTGHWTGFGGYLTCIIAALMCLMLIEYRVHSRTRKVDVFSLGMILGGILSTLTISVLVSALAIILFSWRRFKNGIGALVGLIGLALASAAALSPFLSVRFDEQFAEGVSTRDMPTWLPSTLAHRFVIWQRETIPAILDRPFLGWGSGAYGGETIGRRYPLQLDWLSAESQWLSIAVGYGIWIAVAFAALILLAGALYLRTLRSPLGSPLEPLVTMWIALFLTSFTVAIFTNRGTPSVFYILLGCAAALYELGRTGPKSVPEPAVPASSQSSLT